MSSVERKGCGKNVCLVVHGDESYAWRLGLPIQQVVRGKKQSYSRWWLNQPIWKKMRSRQIGSFPQGSGWKLQNMYNKTKSTYGTYEP